MIDKREKAYQAMAPFIADFVRDLNNMSDDGWSVLVEGTRDQNALRALGYEGDLLTVSQLGKHGGEVIGRRKGVIIMTDLDSEGALLAARFVKRLHHDGVKASLNERRRLKAISHGIFLHIENLSRFSEQEG